MQVAGPVESGLEAWWEVGGSGVVERSRRGLQGIPLDARYKGMGHGGNVLGQRTGGVWCREAGMAAWSTILEHTVAGHRRGRRRCCHSLRGGAVR